MNNKYFMPKYDLNILKHINEHYKISFRELCLKYPEEKFSTNERLVFLISEGYVQYYQVIEKSNIDNQNYKFKRFIVSPKGKKFLQDYFEQKRQDNINNFRTLILEIMRSFFFPLIVSIIDENITENIKK